MSAVFRRLGVENGQAAVSTFGFVETLQTLFDEAERGNVEIARLFPNVRALRGVIGGFGRGTSDQLRDTIRQIEQSQGSAAQAGQIVSESPGDRLLKEFNKIQNFFLNDFGNTVIVAIDKLAQPFGGLAEIVKGFGKAVIDTFGLVLKFEQGLQSLLGVVGVTSIDIETLTKGFIAYKVSVTLLGAAQAIQTRIEQANAAARLLSGEIVVAQANWFTLATAKLVLNTIATGIATAAQTTMAFAVGAANAVMGFAVALMDRHAIAALFAAGAQGVLAAATAAGTLATKALMVAMNALPLVIIATSILYLVGAFDSLIAKYSAAGQAAAKLAEQHSRLDAQFREEREVQNREQTEQSRLFRGDLTARAGAANRVLASLQRAANSLVDAQAQAVKDTEENVRESLDRVKRSMGESISELTQMIGDFKKNIDASMKFELSFKDREAARTFQSALDAAGEVPEVRTGLKPLATQREVEIENFQRRGRTSAANNQQVLIQERILQLTREAREAQLRGDQEGMESARRKFEEIRRLTEQSENIRRGESRAVALDQATDVARRTGQFVTVAYDNGLNRLQERMRAIQQLEEEAEQNFRARQRERQAEAEATRRRQQEAQARFVEASRQLQQLSVTDKDGKIEERFQDRAGEAVGSGLRRFEAEFQALQTRLREAGVAAGSDPVLVEQLIVQLGTREQALRGQIQRQITADHIREVGRRLELERQAIEAAHSRAQQARNTALEAGRELIPRLPGLLGDFDVGARQIASARSRRQTRDGVQETNEQFTARVRLFDEAQRQFNEARQTMQGAIQAVADSRGTDREAEAVRRLQERITALSDAYRRMAALGVGQGQLPGADAGVTGDFAASRQTNLEVAAGRIASAMASLNESNIAIATATQNSANLQAQLLALPESLRLVAAGLDAATVNAAGQASVFDTFAQAVNHLNTEINALRQQPPLVVPQVPVANPRGSAAGGLFGNRFNTRGPDDSLAMVRTGEWIINPQSSKTYHPILKAINAGVFPQHYASGGVVNQTSLGDVTINVDGSKSPTTTANAMMRELKRQKRRGNGGL